MALRSSTMNMPVSSDPSQEQTPDQYNILSKLVILCLMVIASSFWLLILFREKKLFSGTVGQEIAAGLILGFIAGLGAQLVMSKRDFFFRFVAAMTADVAGVYLLGFISGGRYGISQFGWLPKTMDYDGLNSIGLGLIVVLFLCLIFKPAKVVVVPETIEPSFSDGEPDISAPIQVSSVNLGEDMSSVQTPRVSFPRISLPTFLTSGSTRVEPSNGRRRGGLVHPAKVKPAVASKRRRRKGKARVQLALVEEHKCPYCLEFVTRNDPRGVKECKVCHTLHHKDCWDITGFCQVPHLNT
ncbi:MAG: hypothetical protein QM730_13605 [Anaerolineales bacterium]